MGIGFILLKLLLFFTATAAIAAPGYNSIALKKMPLETQKVFEESFKRLSLNKVFIGNSGSEVLGLNMLFSDPFFQSKIAIKYDVKGEFDLNKLYAFKSMNVTHFSYGTKKVAILFKNISFESIEKLKSIIIQNSKKQSFFKLQLIKNAYSDECFRPEIGTGVVVDTQIAEGGTASMISQCLSSAGDGVEDATVGTAKGIWESMSQEAKKLWDDPAGRLGQYADFVGEGIDALWEFSKTVSKMIMDPVLGSKILKEKFGQLGEFFSQAYDNVKAMPFQTKLDVVCNMIGSIGVDVLISALTAGAASGKLGLTVARVFLKIKKISALIGRGITYPFKVMNKLTEKALVDLESIIKAGKKSLFDKKVRELGCAI